ncbi:MAG: BON domain-containing protein [Bacillota bacterium]
MSEQDKRLWRDVLHALQSKLETEAADINLIIQGGKVTLSGVVDVYADKLAAAEAVRAVDGVESVENGLTVATDGEIDDGEIKAAIERKLRQNQLPVVGIEVHHGDVFLRGEARDKSEKAGIASAVTEVMGVKSVNDSGLRVKKE